jgi:hypothetical protein
MPRWSAPRPLQVALATAVVAAFLYPGALFRGEAFFERDLHLDWYPRMAALGHALSLGAWPLWEPGLGFGQPLLADPSVQVLYPVTWLVLALPWGVAYTAFVMVHLFVAGLGAARLAARLGAGSLGSWTSGLGLVLSGPVQSALNLWHHFAGMAWMPWVLLAVDHTVRRPSIGATVALGVAFGLQVLAGSADVCAMTLALSIVLAAARLAAGRGRRGRILPALASCGAALALAAALSSPLWWAAAEVVSRSPRRALPVDVRQAYSVPAMGLVRLVAPLDPARVPFDPDVWSRLYDRPGYPLLWSTYLGLPVLGLGCLAFLDRRRRARAVLLACVLLGAVALAMGPHGALYRPLSELVPGLRTLRYPSKALIIASLASSLLAGLGVRALAGAGRGRAVVAALVLLGSAAGVQAARQFQATVGWTPFLAVAFALVLSLLGRRLRAGLAAFVLVSLAVVDLLAAHLALNATAPVGLLLEPPAVVALVRRDDGQRIHVWDYHTQPGVSQQLLGRRDPYRLGVQAPAALDPRVWEVAAQRQVLVPPTATFFGLETSYDFDNRGLYPRDLNDLSFFLRRVEGVPLVQTRLLQLGAVSRVIALHTRGLEALRLEHELPNLVGDPLRVFAVPDPLPRAHLVARTRVADKGDAIGVLLDPGFDPRIEAIVAWGVALTSDAPFAGSVSWLERRPDRQRLETQAPRPALLVLADAYDPGWRVSVDGAAAELVRANLAFRAVTVPAGRHVVELLYRPRAVVASLGVALVAGLVTVALLFVSRRSGRKRSSA